MERTTERTWVRDRRERWQLTQKCEGDRFLNRLVGEKRAVPGSNGKNDGAHMGA
ncbi:hypothetical protein [Alkalicoccus daliensis]|uniref:hypothetical protein n=1 Tax=Alkalicoccus daliensis TaxID=745820 RepID=UPI0015865343|nr:hypothetical protein [Alkalicoccus daliensis]